MATRAEKLAFAEEMVSILQTQLKETAGVTSAGTDGVSVSVDPELKQNLEYWHKQVQRYSRTKSRTSQIDISGSHD